MAAVRIDVGFADADVTDLPPAERDDAARAPTPLLVAEVELPARAPPELVLRLDADVPVRRRVPERAGALGVGGDVPSAAEASSPAAVAVPSSPPESATPCSSVAAAAAAGRVVVLRATRRPPVADAAVFDVPDAEGAEAPAVGRTRVEDEVVEFELAAATAADEEEAAAAEVLREPVAHR